MIASPRPPPSRRLGARRIGTASVFASSSKSWTSCAQTAPASSISARKIRWSPASAAVWAAAARAPAAELPTFNTVTRTPAAAHAASPSHRPGPPSSSRYSAIAPTRSSPARNDR